MSEVKLAIDTGSYEETVQLGRLIGMRLRGGEAIELAGDLGSGKTALVTGIAKGIDSTDAVSSPTFTINKIYSGRALTIYHFDFYRLPEAGLMSEQLNEALSEDGAVVLVEWGDIVSDVLPAGRIRIQIDRDQADDNKRHFNCTYAEAFAYAVKGVNDDLGA